MDVALVLGPADGAFHYSPLKLAEYLAAGLPVVAPAVGTVTARLTDGVDALLVDPADPAAIGAAVRPPGGTGPAGAPLGGGPGHGGGPLVLGRTGATGHGRPRPTGPVRLRTAAIVTPS